MGNDAIELDKLILLCVCVCRKFLANSKNEKDKKHNKHYLMNIPTRKSRNFRLRTNGMGRMPQEIRTYTSFIGGLVTG
jgi:hypothetical protein